MKLLQGCRRRECARSDVRRHLLDKREVIGSCERGHVLARILSEAELVEAGDVEPLGGRDEAEDADHREAAVIELRAQALLPALGAHLREEFEWVEEIERDSVREAALEARVVALCMCKRGDVLGKAGERERHRAGRKRVGAPACRHGHYKKVVT